MQGTWWFVDIDGTPYFAEAASADAAVFSAMRRHAPAAYTDVRDGFRGYEGYIGFKRVVKPQTMSKAQFKRDVEAGVFTLEDFAEFERQHVAILKTTEYGERTRGLW